MARDFEAELLGADALIRELDAIIAETGSKSLRASARKVTREAVKQYVQPDVLARIPVESGFLESQVKVKASSNRNKVGATIGFSDPLFTGDTYYGGFLEFGTEFIEQDSFLRGPLYSNEPIVRSHLYTWLQYWVSARNRAKTFRF